MDEDLLERLRQLMQPSTPPTKGRLPTSLPPITVTAQAPDLTERFGSMLGRARSRVIKSRNQGGIASRLPAKAVRGVIQGLGQMQPSTAESARVERARTDSALATPLGDSLSALSGGGRPKAASGLRIPLPQPGKGLRSTGTGYYTGILDDMSLGNSYNTRNTLIHEMGHRRNARTLKGQAAFFVPDYAQPDKVEGKQYRETNRAEGYAVAFENAFDVLDRLQKSPALPSEAAIQRMLAGREKRVPGTTRLFYEMLAEPLYENHPLRQRK